MPLATRRAWPPLSRSFACQDIRTAAREGCNPLAGSVRNSRVWSASDEGLLAGVAAGDRDAAVAFVRRYQRRMYGLALTIVGEAALAEDLAQEAFVRVWRHAANYD